MDAASSSNPSCILEVGEKYPYPSHFAPNFVTVKLSGKNKYNIWKTQMLCLLSSHGMLGFINGQFVSPCDGSGKAKVGDMDAWIRSDSLVKGWILGSLYEQAATKLVNRLTSKHKNTDFSAKDVWDELQRSYGPSVREQATAAADEKSEDQSNKNAQPDDNSDIKQELYSEILRGKLEQVDQYFGPTFLKPTDKLMNNGNTALHVAVGSSTKNHKFLEKFLAMIPAQNTLLDVRNSDGSTPLYIAAIVGNTKAVDILVERDQNLLLSKDNDGHTPLALSLSNMHSETSWCLFDHIKEKGYLDRFDGKSVEELKVLAISSKEFSLAHMMSLGILDMMRLYINKKELEPMVTHSDAVLMAIAQNFPREPNFWEMRGGISIEDIQDRLREREQYNYVYRRGAGINIEDIQDRLRKKGGCCYEYWRAKLLRLYGPSVGKLRRVSIIGLFQLFLKGIVTPFIKDKFQIYEDATCLLWRECNLIRSISESDTRHHCYTNPIFEATRLNAFRVVTNIVSYFPDAIWSTNEDGHNFIQYSVIYRSEKIYTLLNQMSEHRNIYKTIKDSSGNNLLHLAARLAPTNKLNIISGAALQIQRELQWFKEVEAFVCPLNYIQKNSDDETPQMVFTREHKDLVMEGEKWMKATAESYTITAALITTIVFAAAITVPGGNKQDSGIPIYTNNIAFTIFAISDAISLFTAVTSLLMFLSILTTRFAEEDFLFKLPKRLMIGLAMLFISTTAMIIAFGATLFLMFGQMNLWMLIPIGILTCLPITSFVTLQFPLIVDLISATYGSSIFVKKKSNEYFY